MRRSLTVLVVAALALMGCSDTGDDDGDSGGVGQGAPAGAVWAPQSGMDFDSPENRPVDIPATNQPGVRDVSVTLTVRWQTIDVSGSPLYALPFEATDDSDPTREIPTRINGPTLHVRPGGRITITFINESGQDTNIHYHGLHVSPKGESDNVFQVFKSGAGPRASIVDLPENHPVGTFWYHAHMHGISESQVNGGLSGMLIVEGLEQTINTEIRDADQRQFALREVRTLGDGTIDRSTTTVPQTTTTTAPPPTAQTTVLVNGLKTPKVTVNKFQYEIWRFANIGVNQAYHISKPDELHAWIIAEDGNPIFDVDRPFRIPDGATIDLPAGKRFDVLVYPSDAMDPGQTYSLTSTGVTDPLVTIAVVAPPSVPLGQLEPSAVDTDTSGVPDDGLRTSRIGLPINMEREFRFSFGAGSAAMVAGRWTDPSTGQPVTFGPKIFEPDVTDVAVRLGDLEQWTIYNDTGQVHPFHIHVNEFQVVSVYDPANPDKTYTAIGTADVLEVPAAGKTNGTVTTNPDGTATDPGRIVILNHFVDYDGHFVFHCHILNHEDRGMMATIQVLRPGEQPSPPPHDSSGAVHGRIKVG